MFGDLPETTYNGNLEDQTVKVFHEIGVKMDSKNVENCHWIKTHNPKNIVMKFSSWKDVKNIRIKN